MSYVKCKGITLKEKENSIKICGADNNVYPLTYSTYELSFKNNETFKEKMFEVFRNISGGCLQLNTSLYKWNYAIIKTNEELNYGWSTLYYETEHKDTLFYIGKKPFVMEENEYRLQEITDADINDNYVLIDEYNGNKQYYEKTRRLADDKRILDINNKYYDTFMKYFNEKDTEKKYCLYSNIYGYFVRQTKYGFKYSLYGSTKKIGTYKEVYCNRYDIDYNNKYNFEIKEVLNNE